MKISQVKAGRFYQVLWVYCNTADLVWYIQNNHFSLAPVKMTLTFVSTCIIFVAQKSLKHRRVKHYGFEFRYDNNNVDKDKPLPAGKPHCFLPSDNLL